MIDLEQLADGSVSDRNFRKLMSLVLDTGGQSVGVRFGAGVVTWPGSSTISNVLLVDHGLGRLPVVTLGTHNDQTGTGLCMVECGSNTTQTSVRLATTSFTPGSGTSSSVSWLAIG